jgi:uncharacterized heparinase superfamily protein
MVIFRGDERACVGFDDVISIFRKIGSETMDLGRLARTAVHLQPGQIMNRLIRRRPRVGDVMGPPPRTREPARRWAIHAPHPQSMLSPTRFRFLSEEHEIDAPTRWNDAALPRLWIYNLHYFDDLLSIGRMERDRWHRDLIARWICENPPLAGAGWEPYPLSRRSVNWIVSALSGAVAPAGLEESLAIQARVLRRSLEYHLRGNHLFVDAKALIFLGCFFEGEEAEEWRALGLDLMDQEAAEQILGDGAHFERSTMYHALLLEDVLDLVQLAEVFPSTLGRHASGWRGKVERMLEWLAAMSHPDGEIGFFNDAAFNEARNLAALSGYAKALGIAVPEAQPGSIWFQDSGYIRLAGNPWTVLFDVAPVGPDYIPGHGHADTLSFELSLDRERIVTNGGTSTYENTPVRWGERGTGSHATVEIDGRDSSEVWASFRVGRRARPSDIAFSSERNEAKARHDGYRFLSGRPTHERKIQIADGRVRVSDVVLGTGEHNVVARFPLHPDVRVDEHLDQGWRLRTAQGRTVEVRIEGMVEREVAEGHFAPEFGVRLPRQVLTWRRNCIPSSSIITSFEFSTS